MNRTEIINILDRSEKSVGTGFFVSSEGHILTCKHVLYNAGYNFDKTSNVIKFKYEGKSTVHYAKWIILDPEEDLAVILAEKHEKKHFIPLSRNVVCGETVSCYGFPEGSKRKIKANPRIDRISDDRRIQLGNANNITFGFSGAPLIYEDAVIGIIDSITNSNENGRLIEIAFAIPIEYVLEKYSNYKFFSEKMMCVGYGDKSNRCLNHVFDKEHGLCKSCYEKQFLDIVKSLYNVQNYEIISCGCYFIIKLKYGISTYYEAVFTIVKFNEALTVEDVISVTDTIKGCEYNISQTVIVTNAEVNPKCSSYINQNGIKIKYKEELIKGLFDFNKYRDDLRKYVDSQQLATHYIEIYGTKIFGDEEEESTEILSDKSLDDEIIFDWIEDDEFLYFEDECEDLDNGADVYMNTSGENERLLKKYVDCFLNSKHKALLVLGDYGSGKTSFCYKYALDMLDAYMNNQSKYLPILIKLRGYNKALSINQLLTDYFVNELNVNNFNIASFKLMLKNIDILLIFDGYDEVAKKVDFDIKYEVLKEICSFIEEKTKIMITCRPNYFQNEVEFKRIFEKSALQYEPGDKPFPPFIENSIAELTPLQIETYINSYQEQFAEHDISIIEILDTIRETHDLTDLVKRPFLLYMIVNTLPEILNRLKGRNNEKINAAKLYSVYTDNWIKREEQKNKTLIKQSDKELFCKEVAFELYISDAESLSYKEFPDTIRNYFKDLERIEEIDYFTHDIQSCSFLTSNRTGEFKFIHRSFMEYFVADRVIAKLAECMGKRGRKSNTINEILGNTYLSMEICLFINDMIDSKKENVIEKVSKFFEAVNGVAKSNIISILSKTRTNMALFLSKSYVGNEHLIHTDFSNAQFREGTLFNVLFSGTQLYSVTFENTCFIDCDFYNVRFEKISFENVDFQNCNFDFAQWKNVSILNSTFDMCTLVDNYMELLIMRDSVFKRSDFSGMTIESILDINNNEFPDSVGIPYEF